MSFQQMKNIDTAFRYVRGFSLAVAAGSLLLCAFALNKSFRLVRETQGKIYLLGNGKALEAYASERRDNIPVEARDHIKSFHLFFFTLDPDEKVITANISRALYLADGSAKREYDDLKESGYYANIIAGNISQELTVDSIRLDVDRSPYFFQCFATERIVRTTSVAYRNLITQGWLRNVSRSDNDPHGFLIERWSIIENKDLKIENR